jgi:hypothetical protein
VNADLVSAQRRTPLSLPLRVSALRQTKVLVGRIVRLLPVRAR